MKTILICAAAAASAFALPAMAKESGYPENTVIVRYADLDLSQASDRFTLNDRVNDAVATVCRRHMSAAMEDLGACRSALRKHVIENAAPEVQRALANRNVAVASASRASD